MKISRRRLLESSGSFSIMGALIGTVNATESSANGTQDDKWYHDDTDLIIINNSGEFHELEVTISPERSDELKGRFNYSLAGFHQKNRDGQPHKMHGKFEKHPATNSILRVVTNGRVATVDVPFRQGGLPPSLTVYIEIDYDGTPNIHRYVR